MRYLAIDPGGSTGWAVFEDGKLLDCGACAPPGLRWRGIQGVLVEMPQKYPHDNVDSNNLITLAYRLGRVVGPLEIEGVPIRTVHPKEWKGQLSKDVCHLRGRKKMTPPELELMDLRALPLSAKARLDMLDAVCLGLWALTTGMWHK